jgi:hypothetical protein
MDTNIFMDRNTIPDDGMLKSGLGASYKLWQCIESYVLKKYSEGKPEWNYSGVKYGWSYRIKDKKRAIIYLLPSEKYFRAAFVFGEKATTCILASTIDDAIKQELKEARVYAEGRGIRISIRDEKRLSDIYKLIEIKLMF